MDVHSRFVCIEVRISKVAITLRVMSMLVAGRVQIDAVLQRRRQTRMPHHAERLN